MGRNILLEFSVKVLGDTIDLEGHVRSYIQLGFIPPTSFN